MSNFERIYEKYGLVDKESLRGQGLKVYNFFNDIMYKIMDSDEVLKNYKDKVDFYLCSKSSSCFIAPREVGELDSVIVISPDVCPSGLGKSKEDHYAAYVAHELGHFFLKLRERRLVPDDYFLREGKSFSAQIDKFINMAIKNDKINETLSDVIGLKFLEQAGYSPTAMIDIFEKDYFISRARDFINLTIDEHPSNQDRKFNIKSVLAALEVKVGKVSDNSKKKVSRWINFDKAQSQVDSLVSKRVKSEKKGQGEKNKEEGVAIDEGKNNPLNKKEKKETWEDFIKKNKDGLLRNLLADMDKDPTFYTFRDLMKFARNNLSKKEIIDIVANLDVDMFKSDSDRKRINSFKSIVLTNSKDEIRSIMEKSGGSISGFASSHNMWMPSIDLFVGDVIKDYIGESYVGLSELINMNEGLSYCIHIDTIDVSLLSSVQSKLVEMLENEKNSNRKIEVCHSLLSEDRIDSIDTRKRMFELLSDEYLNKFGLDDGSEEYANNFSKLIKIIGDYSKYEHQRPPLVNHRVELLNIVAKKVVAQRDLSYKFRDCLYEAGASKLDNISKIETPAMEALSAIFNEYKYTRNDFVDFLQDKYTVERAHYVRDKISGKIDDVINGLRQTKISDEIKEYEKNIYIYKLRDLAKARDLTDEKLQQIHEEFWSRDLDGRATFLAKILDSDLSSKDSFARVFDRSLNKIIPKEVENRKFMKTVIKEYVNAYEDYSKPFLLSAIMSATKKVENGEDFRVGDPLKEFLENLGPAGIKLGQALGSSPDVPEDIREVMQTMKNHADEPTRWDLFDMLDASVPQEKLGYIGEVIGSGSYFVTVDNGDTVFGLVRPHARDRAKAGFKVMLKACNKLSGYMGRDYRIFSSVLKNIIQKADYMADIETDMQVGSVQDEMAQQIYNDKELKVGEDSFSMKVAEWKSFGDEYKEVEKVVGVHFNDLPSGKFKTEFAKAYVKFELDNIFSGFAFDHDRHGAQMKIDMDNKTIGIFDNGAMASWAPSVKEKEQLGKVVSNTIFGIAFYGKSVNDSLNDAIGKEVKANKSSDYILSVQRGLLALNDYMREISNEDKVELLKGVLFSDTLDDDIKNGFTLKHKMLMRFSDKYLNKIEESKESINGDKYKISDADCNKNKEIIFAAKKNYRQ